MVVHGRDSNRLAFFQLPRLTVTLKVKAEAQLGKIGPHIAGVLLTCSKSYEYEEKNGELHFPMIRFILSSLSMKKKRRDLSGFGFGELAS